jgi:hypothetical protein
MDVQLLPPMMKFICTEILITRLFHSILFSIVVQQSKKIFTFFLEKVTNVFFHLYGQIHPRGPNYRINFIELVIEKCNNIESCQQLNDCRKAVCIEQSVAIY